MKQLTAICLFIFLAACNNNSNHDEHNRDSAINSTAHQSHNMNSDFSNTMQQEMDKMMSNMMKVALTNNADHDFALLMKLHHQAAVEMAKLVLQNGKDSVIKKFAEQVVDGQSKEISQFDAYLQKSDENKNDKENSNDMIQSMHRHMEPYKPLNKDADHDFVFLMIPHHQSAVEMSEVYLKKAKDEGLKSLASSIIKGQSTEIEQLKQWMVKN